MKKIFISYRRDDEPFATKILYDKLAAYFGSDEIFYDIGDIPKGAHFLELIEQSISQCGAAIAIIGSKWLTLTGDDGQPRLSNPNDMVRFELEAALRRKIPILPILINDAKMPHPDAVPQSLREICFLQDHHVHSNDQFDREVSEVIQFLIEKLRQPANLTDVIM
ncbi:MAG TPA: toll/interleukin-1 receptor domain-containing protein, partial [Ktedonobacterales bacterium]|nr:toll/interleukin-1 receptor domain-containing protein [Ktedonobacterales bacterium]